MKGFTQREQTMLSRFYPDGTLPFDGDRLTVTHEGSGVAVSCINGRLPCASAGRAISAAP